MNIVIAEPDEFPADCAYALQDPDAREQCAVLLGNRDGNDTVITHVFGVENLSRSRDHWMIGRSGYAAAAAWGSEHGVDVVGHIHTHWTMPYPSAQDLRSARNLICAVWSIDTGELIWYDQNGEIKREPMSVPADSSTYAPA